ncbi:MAG TPA: hypothetical protein VMN57_17245 [Anaerolineales bacterium]|nr:hypothetical protein [Anaerolineales bacterium]
MKIWLDRRVCDVWEAACESDFADKFLGDEVLPAACTVMLAEEDDNEQIVFYIRDRDGSEKELVVDDGNLAEAIDSWMKAYADQQAKKKVDVPADQVL